MEAAHSAREQRQLGAQTAAGRSFGEGPAETKYPAEGQAARAAVAAGAARIAGAAGLGEKRVGGMERACLEGGLGEGLAADPAAAVSGSGCWPWRVKGRQMGGARRGWELACGRAGDKSGGASYQRISGRRTRAS
jgi:hypothetical protein